MKLQLDTELDCDFETVVAHVKTPRLLMHICAPLVYFHATDGTVVPDVWEEETYWFKLKIFGFLPFGRQAVRISFHEAEGAFKIRDDGYSRLIRRWDHWITIVDKGEGQTHYQDSLDLDAGILTPFVWLFARLFYGHRQKRWRQLVKSGFRYGAS